MMLADKTCDHLEQPNSPLRKRNLEGKTISGELEISVYLKKPLYTLFGLAVTIVWE